MAIMPASSEKSRLLARQLPRDHEEMIGISFVIGNSLSCSHLPKDLN